MGIYTGSYKLKIYNELYVMENILIQQLQNENKFLKLEIEKKNQQIDHLLGISSKLPSLDIFEVKYPAYESIVKYLQSINCRVDNFNQMCTSLYDKLSPIIRQKIIESKNENVTKEQRVIDDNRFMNHQILRDPEHLKKLFVFFKKTKC